MSDIIKSEGTYRIIGQRNFVQEDHLAVPHRLHERSVVPGEQSGMLCQQSAELLVQFLSGTIDRLILS